MLPASAGRVPFAVVLVELAEDPQLRVVGNMAAVPVDPMRIGMPVTVAFERIADGRMLPQWRAAP